jgi:acyl-coenzyme A synthetase/AMP-(fatty) acid ligase
MGASVVILPLEKGFRAEDALRMIEEHRVTTAHMVPAMFIRILDLPEETRERYDMSTLRVLMHAAAPCPVDVKWKIMDYFGKGVVWEYYGGSEGGGTMITDEDWRRKPGSVGKPWPMSEVRIYDDQGNLLPANQLGTIYMTAAGLRFEYHKDMAKTQQAHIEGFFTMGDMGYLDGRDRERPLRPSGRARRCGVRRSGRQVGGGDQGRGPAEGGLWGDGTRDHGLVRGEAVQDQEAEERRLRRRASP